MKKRNICTFGEGAWDIANIFLVGCVCLASELMDSDCQLWKTTPQSVRFSDGFVFVTRKISLK